MTTNQLSLLCAANVRVLHFRQHLVRRRARVGLMPCAFASLRLCVLTASVPTQRRKGAKTQRGLGQEANGGSSPSLASVVIREIRVIRGQLLPAKVDDLTPQMLGAIK